jgi:hypothetical protein
MALSQREQALLKQAFEVIASDDALAREVARAVENKWWYKVKSIVNSVLASFNTFIDFTVDAIESFFGWLFN